jgi:gliding motility-associated-like protein
MRITGTILLILKGVIFASRSARMHCCVLAVLLFSMPVFSADYYWVGGSGNWSDINHWATTSGGAVKHMQVPTAYDDVYFDAHSFSAPGQQITVNAGNYVCRSMSWAGVQHTPQFYCPPAYSFRIYGSLLLAQDMYFNAAGALYFESGSAGCIIDMAGHAFRQNVFFNGPGGEWTLHSDADLQGNSLVLMNGSLRTNGYAITCGSFYSMYNTIRQLHLSNSVIQANSWSLDVANLLFDCGTASIILSGNNATLTNKGGQANYHVIRFTSTTGQSVFINNAAEASTVSLLEFHSNAKIFGNIQTDELRLHGVYYELRMQDTLTVMQSLLASGTCNAPLMLFSNSDTINAVFRAGSNLTVDYVWLRNVEAVSLNGSQCVALNSVDLGNSSGWIISGPPPLDLYWVGGSGNWNDPQHWALQSNGQGGNCIPCAYDNVYFDAHSFHAPGQTVNINPMKAFCNNMNWTGVLHNPAITGSTVTGLYIYGSLHLDQNMQFNFSGFTSFEARTPGKYILMAGRQFNNNVIFNGAGGSWDLLDEFNAGNSIVHFRNGSLFTNSNTLRCGSFLSSTATTRSLQLGASALHITGGGYTAWNLGLSGLSFDAGTSTIFINAPGGGLQSSTGDTVRYHYVNFTNSGGMARLNSSSVTGLFKMVKFSGCGILLGDNVYDSLYFGRTDYILGSGKTQTILTFLGNDASCVLPVSLRASADGTPAIVHKSGGIVMMDYLVMKDVHTSGGASFHALHSVDMGNNTGWQFTSPAPSDLYWVGGSGNWNDPMHWSFSSGGGGGACTPTPFDNVFFDANSFSAPGQAVQVSAMNAYCKNMTWHHVLHNPQFIGSTSSTLHVYGSLALSPDIEWNLNSPMHFRSQDTGKLIFSAGNVFKGDVVLCGEGGGWSLGDDFHSLRSLQIMTGKFYTQDNDISCLNLKSSWTTQRTIDLGSSQVWLDANSKSALLLHSGLLQFGGSSSVIHITAPSGGITTTGSAVTLCFGKVLFAHSSGSQEIRTQNAGNVFRRVVFSGNGMINGNNTFDTLSFHPSKTYTLQSGMTQTILSRLDLTGSGCFPIALKSSNPGVPANIFKSSGNVSVAYVEMQDQHATGGAGFYAGEYSVDLTGNSGWVFGSNPAYVFGFPDTMSFCQGDTLGLDASLFTGASSYAWQDGSTGLVYPVTQPGKFWLTVTYADQCFVIDTVDVVYTPQPFAFAGNDTIVCYGTHVVLSAQGPPGASYQWSGNLSGQQVSINPTAPATYSVSVTNACGMASAEVIVGVIPLPYADAGDDKRICHAGDPVTLTASATPGSSMLWNTGESGAQIIVSPSETSQYVFTVVNQCGSVTDSVTVQVFAPGELDIAIYDETCNMSNGAATVSGWLTYQWSNGANTETIAGLQAGVYTVTVGDGHCTASAVVTVDLIERPKADFIAKTDLALPGQYAVDCYDHSEGAVFRHWNFGDGYSSGLQNPRHSYRAAGSYQITLVVFDLNQCSDTVVKSIEFAETEMFVMPNAFSPNGDALNDAFGPIWLHKEWVKEYRYSVYDRWGGLIFTTSDTDCLWDGRHVADRNKVPSATYVWSIEITDVTGKDHRHAGSVFVFHTGNRMASE